ncbi:hypothetical protein DPMN_059441 [Dreissena polymorpha]|uniref:Uncharacterized protein n=1 Tax=Dreissena polymorpha TaxID=45954 RepID=A0A9D4C448_DREPO|nr:hypothetical protein DPMN_059441 [Dreissena polymorpha]
MGSMSSANLELKMGLPTMQIEVWWYYKESPALSYLLKVKVKQDGREQTTLMNTH